jgi:hypothetical protein
MDIPLNAQVEYTDGVVWHAIGHSEYVLINPVIEQVTHLVVKEDTAPNTEYVVPVELVAESTADTIRLHCNKEELEKLDPFIKTTVIENRVPNRNFGYSGGIYGLGSNFFIPFVTSESTIYDSEEIQQIPAGELAVQRGTRVEATDGYVGKVDEFVVNPENGRITHLVMREGHLWGKKDVIIPLSAMGETHEDTVFLKLSKDQIEALPTFPLNRHWS